jgi:C4-dicarboxylate-binding protein DctP
MTREQDLSAKKVLSEKGMTVTELTPTEIERFRLLAQPAVKSYLDAEVSKEWADKLLTAANATAKK